jgi:hypothetical protein
MRLKEFATPDAQLELWKMVSDAVWAAINKQKSQQGQPTVTPEQDPALVARAQDAKAPVKSTPIKPKPRVATKKKSSPKKATKIRVPARKPVPQPKPLPKSSAKPQQAQAPLSQLQQPQQPAKPAINTAHQQSPQIAKTPVFSPKPGVFPQNQRLLKQKPIRG